MLLGVFQLLEAKRGEIDAGRMYVEALRDYWIARAELERAIGGRLELVPAATQATTAPATAPAASQPAVDHSKHHHH